MYTTVATHKEITAIAFPIGALGVNCTIIYHEKNGDAIIIDGGDSANTLLDTIAKYKLNPKIYAHTHAHFDHIGSVSKVKTALPAPTALHAGDLPLYEALETQGRMFGAKTETGLPIDIILEEGPFPLIEGSLSDFAKTIRVILTDGHTQGGCCFYTEFFTPPLLVAGDTLFKNSIGRTDFPGGDFLKLIKNISTKLMTLPPETVVITGHGPFTTVDFEKRYNSFLNA